MLKLLEKKSPAQVEVIHRNARAWYSRQTGWRAKAEQLYHTLQLGEFGFDAGFQHPDTRSSLQFSISELPPAAQRYLATLGYQVSDEILARATREEREASTAAQIENLLPYGPRSVEHARSIVEEQPIADHASPLFRSAARVAAQQERLADAERSLEIGLRYAFSEGQSREALDLLCEQAWLLRRQPALGDLRASLSMLAEHAQRFADLTAMFQHRAQLFELHAGVESAAVLRDITELVEHLTSNSLWNVFPVLDAIIDPLWDRSPRAYSRVIDLIADLEGPFSHVELPQGSRELAGVLEFVSRATGGERVFMTGARNTLNDLIRRACAAWPYRVLRVNPPYSTASYEPSELVQA